MWTLGTQSQFLMLLWQRFAHRPTRDHIQGPGKKYCFSALMPLHFVTGPKESGDGTDKHLYLQQRIAQTLPLPTPPSSLTVPCPTQPHPKSHPLGSLYGSGSYKSPANELGRRVGADNGPGRCLHIFCLLSWGSRGRRTPGAEVEKDRGLPFLPLPRCSQCSESWQLTGSVLPGSRRQFPVTHRGEQACR